MYRNPPLPSMFRRVGLSFLLGFGVFVLGALVQHLLESRNIHGMVGYADDLIVGLFAGLLVFAYEQRQHRTVRARIRVIAGMNHHVRNALQAITFSRYAEDAKQIEIIQNATQRIQWALDEILPGEPQSSQVPTDNAMFS